MTGGPRTPAYYAVLAGALAIIEDPNGNRGLMSPIDAELRTSPHRPFPGVTARPRRQTSLTRTDKPKITNYSCRISAARTEPLLDQSTPTHTPYVGNMANACYASYRSNTWRMTWIKQ